MTNNLTIPTSILINGIWQAANWSAELLDDDTGEILLTAVAGETELAIRLTMDDVALLRQTLPAFAQANARRDATTNPPDPSHPSDATCYDCSTNQTRLDTLDAEYVTLCQHLDMLKRRITRIEQDNTLVLRGPLSRAGECMMDKCRICGEYKIEIFGSHRCGPSYQVVIIGNDDPPSAPFELRDQLSVKRVFSQYDMSDAVQDAVADYHCWSAEYSDNTTVGAMTWEQWQRWEAEHEEDDALVDPALLTWYDVTLRMEPAYAAHKLSRPSAGGGG